LSSFPGNFDWKREYLDRRDLLSQEHTFSSLLRLIRFLLLLILRIVLSPLDISIGENGAFSISIIASLIMFLVLFALEVRQESLVEFGFEEYV
jgi:hypothetical protein